MNRNRREKIKTMVKNVCKLGIALSNVGLVLCCILVFRGIISKQSDILIFSMQMFVFFIITLQLSEYFKDYLD